MEGLFFKNLVKIVESRKAIKVITTTTTTSSSVIYSMMVSLLVYLILIPTYCI